MLHHTQKERLTHFFFDLQKRICLLFNKMDPQHTMEKKEWIREKKEYGGGVSYCVLNGNIFEKAGVNVSAVYGPAPEALKKKISTKATCFWASGLSLITHPQNPFVPAVHMNVRCIETDTFWFGGGIDLTPVIENKAQADFFHQTLKDLCQRHPQHPYLDYKNACDEYFYLPHRQEARGIGGIFYDNIHNDFETDFAFTQDLGETFMSVYTRLVTENQPTPWSAVEKQAQFEKRAKYAEFNLLYDRGIQFGLATGGNIDAMFVSMPPRLGWT